MRLRGLIRRHRRDRELARLARTYDLYVQSSEGHRLIQMRFDEALSWAEKSGHRMLAANVSVYRREPGARLLDAHGNPEPAYVLSAEGPLAMAEYEALKARWLKLHGNNQAAHHVEELRPVSPVACSAYRPPTEPADSGLCAGCGMFDYKHRESP